MSFKCKCCNYSTDIKCNYLKHTKTITHIENENRMLKCDKCTKIFLHESTYNNHINKHHKIESKITDPEIKLLLLEKENKNLLLEQEVKFLKEKSELEIKLLKENKEELSKTKDKHIEYLQQTNIENSRMSHISQLSAINFASMYYNKSIGMIGVDKKAQKIDKGIRQLPDMKIWIKESPELADQYVAEKLIVLYSNDKFIDYICSVIHNAYKTEDPLDQTIWSTDVSRLVYIVRITLEKENKWEYDKKGVRIKQSIIDPLLDEVQDIMIEYVEKIHTLSKSNAKIDYLKKLELVNIAKTIIHELKNRLSIKNRIIKALAPMFFLERTVKQIEYKYPEGLEVQLVKKKK